jgi:hypothetical protein
MELAVAGDDMMALREIAKAHIAKCKEGDLQAIKELADRLDGRPAPMLEHSGSDGRQIRKVICEIVHVTETKEMIEEEDGLLVDFQELKTVNGGSDGGQ